MRISKITVTFKQNEHVYEAIERIINNNYECLKRGKKMIEMYTVQLFIQKFIPKASGAIFEGYLQSKMMP